MPPTFPQLCAAFTFATEQLKEWPLHTRRPALAQLAWWSGAGARSPVPRPITLGLEQLWRDACVRELEPGQKLLLHWMAAAVAGGWSQHPEWARSVVDLSMEAALTVWRPHSSGTGPTRPRLAVGLLPDIELPPDPSGDPEESQPALKLEPRRGQLEWAWSSVGDVLDGLAVWPSAVQTHLALPLGNMRRTGQPDWGRLIGDDGWVEVRRVFAGRLAA